MLCSSKNSLVMTQGALGTTSSTHLCRRVRTGFGVSSPGDVGAWKQARAGTNGQGWGSSGGWVAWFGAGQSCYHSTQLQLLQGRRPSTRGMQPCGRPPAHGSSAATLRRPGHALAVAQALVALVLCHHRLALELVRLGIVAHAHHEICVWEAAGTGGRREGDGREAGVSARKGRRGVVVCRGKQRR